MGGGLVPANLKLSVTGCFVRCWMAQVLVRQSVILHVWIFTYIHGNSGKFRGIQVHGATMTTLTALRCMLKQNRMMTLPDILVPRLVRVIRLLSPLIIKIIPM